MSASPSPWGISVGPKLGKALRIAGIVFLAAWAFQVTMTVLDLTGVTGS